MAGQTKLSSVQLAIAHVLDDDCGLGVGPGVTCTEVGGAVTAVGVVGGEVTPFVTGAEVVGGAVTAVGVVGGAVTPLVTGAGVGS